MKAMIKKLHAVRLILCLAVITVLPFVSGCARYARDVNVFYEPAAGVQGGAGDVYILIPENQQTQSPAIKWVLGDITDSDNRKIDDVTSARSPAEIIRTVLALELRKSGYTAIPTARRHGDEQRIIDLTKSEIKLEQVSSLTNLKAKCRVIAVMDVSDKGQLIKRLQYESVSSITDINDRDVLAKNVLEEALRSVMLKAIPDLHSLFKK